MYFQEQTHWFLHSPRLVASSIVFIFILHVITTRYSHIRSIPGPFLASFTNLYRFFHQWTWRSQYTQMVLHKKYGKFVRYGPNLVSISDPQAIPEIYGIGKGFVKVCNRSFPGMGADCIVGILSRPATSVEWEGRRGNVQHHF